SNYSRIPSCCCLRLLSSEREAPRGKPVASSTGQLLFVAANVKLHGTSPVASRTFYSVTAVGGILAAALNVARG
ncbi:MAG TPA: hypothetical protein VJ180_05950, partial [Pyrinomonadaceae bacterium]|nr:hypothetical protein [Pyrinomonadaceae bacterium]